MTNLDLLFIQKMPMYLYLFKSNQLIYLGNIDKQLNYQTNHQCNYIKWLDISNQNKLVYIFKFDPYDASLTARVYMEKALTQQTYTKNFFEDIEDVKQ